MGPDPAKWRHWWELESAQEKVHKLVVANDIDGLIRKLRNDKNWAVRERAALALSQYEDGRSLEPLLYAMEDDENVDVRVRATWAVGALRDPRAIEPLLQTLKSTVKSLRDEAQLSLQNITGEQIMKADRASWIRWWQKNRSRIYREAASRKKHWSNRTGLPTRKDDPESPLGTGDGDVQGVEEPSEPGDSRTADIVLIVVGSLIGASFLALLIAQAMRKPRKKKRKRRKRR